MSDSRIARLSQRLQDATSTLADGFSANREIGEPAWALPGAPSLSEPGARRTSETEAGWLLAEGGDEPRRVETSRRREQQTAPSDRQRAEASQRQTGSSGGGGSSGGSSGGGRRPGGGFPTRAGGGVGGIAILLIVGFMILRSCMGGGDGGGGNVAEQVLQQAAQSGVLDQVQQAVTSGASGSGATITEGDLPPEVQQLLALFGANQFASGTVQEVAMPAQSASQVTVTPIPLPTRNPNAPAASTGAGGTAGGDTWTIMLYQDADDQVLERDIHVDLNEAERATQSPNVRVIAQIDRFRGGYNGDGNITGAKRYLVQHDEDLNSVGSQELMDIGEPNMADPATLVDFVVWAMENYPADKYALIMSDHGMGWPGGWTDPSSTAGATSGNPLSQVMGDILYLNEIDAALQTIRDRTGLDKFELVGMDACLMSHAEVYSALAPHARYSVTSQETEPAVGWAYAAFLNQLVANPSMTGGELGQAIVDTYILGDQRIIDPNARAEFARGSAQAVAQQLYRGVTLSAADLSQWPAFNDAFNNYLYALQNVDQNAVAKARSYAQSFTSVFGSNVPPSYLDIGHFMLLTAQQTRDNNVIAAAQNVANALQNLIVKEMHGQDKPSATGLSVYFPNSQLIRSQAAGLQAYGVVSERFVNESLWDDFLYFHYTGNNFEEAPQTARTVTAEQSGAMRSPASGGISVDPIWASADEVAIRETVQLTTIVDGENLGYIKLLVGELDQNANSLRLLDADYLQAPDTVEMRGSYYPEWGEGAFILDFDWEPYVTAITDGETNATVLMNPENYGATSEDAIYSVDGIYTIASDNAPRYARMYFRDGAMTEVYGFSGTGNQGAPAQITPAAGDTFTVLETWLDFNDDGSTTQVQQEGPTLNINPDEPLRWIEMDAAAGQYTVGILVEDLDGQQYPVYTQIEVLP